MAAKEDVLEYYRIAIGNGVYTSELASNIPDGYSAECYNMVATGDSVENRIAFRRPTVDFKVLEISPGYHSWDSDDYNYFCHINPWGKDSSKPAFMWGAKGFAVPGAGANSATLHLVRAAGVTDANDGYIAVNMPQSVTGIAQYQGTIYFALSTDGIKKITNINWATDTITYSAIASSAGATLRGLFTFKDRLWAHEGHYLYFTDLPTVGSLPETWSLASNRISFVGPNGAGTIKKVLPLGNRLAVFTTNGLFTLLVEGSPASWILRILDSKSICTSSQCAFESKGIIYYINTQGVWATNTLTATKLSGSIDDQWFLAKGSRIHTIAPYEDGMVVSIAKHVTDERYFSRDDCRVYYTKLDPIAWAEWGFNKHDDANLNVEQLALVWSMTDKIPTYLNTEPTVYVMGMITDSVQALNTNSVMQLWVMDGGVDEYVNRLNVLETLPVFCFLKTKHFDGGQQYKQKKSMKGMIEIYTSDAEHEFTTSWDIDDTIDESTEVDTRMLNDFTVGRGSNIVQLPARFPYRRASFNLRVALQTNDSQIKVKDLVLVQNTGRDEFEQVR